MSVIVGSRIESRMIKKFPASLEKLYEMLDFVKEQAAIAGFPLAAISKIELASEEALVNIISYGYIERQGIIELTCTSPDSAGIKIIIRDHGIPYNPLIHAKTYETKSPLESRSLGGYGVFFILKIMDEVAYHREEDFNTLTLVKYLSL